MNQKLDMERVRHLLNRSTAQLDQTTVARLQQTRAHALERHAAQHAHTLALSGHGKSAHWHTALSRHKAYLWIAGLLLMAGIISGGIAYMQHKAPGTDNSDVDIAILTDDLPLQVYLD